jgi:hypothetical protein
MNRAARIVSMRPRDSFPIETRIARSTRPIRPHRCF